MVFGKKKDDSFKEEKEKKEKKEKKHEEKKHEEKKEEKKDEKKEEKKDEKKEEKKEEKKPTDTMRSKSAVSSTSPIDSPKASKMKSSSDLGKELPKPSENDLDDENYSFRRLVNNPLFADVSFIVGQSKVPGHACIIELRCSSLLKSGRKKKNISEIDVASGIFPNTFLELMSYLYTNTVDFSKMKELDALLLLSASNKYEGLERLRFMCEKHLKVEMNIKNAHYMLKIADELHLDDFKQVILHFSVNHYTEFISDKNAIKELGIGLFQEVVAMYQEVLTKTLKPLPEPQEPKDTFLEDFKALFDSVKLSDISFKLAETNAMGIAGQQIRGHKAIVVGRAPGLAPIVNQSPDTSKGVFTVPVKGISPEGFESILRWIYYAEINIPTLVACELISVCQQFSLFSLERICLNAIRKGIQVDSVLTILNVSYLQGMPAWFNISMEEIRPKAVQFAADHIKDIDFEKIRSNKLSDSIAPDILTYLQTVR